MTNNDAHTRRGLLLAIGAFVAWGLLSPGNAILLEQYPPMWMQVFRAGLATLFVLVWVGSKSLDRVASLFQRRPAVFVALLVGTFISFGLFVFSQTRIPAVFTTLGFYTSPLWTAALARPMLGERVGWSFVPTVLALLGGGYLALTGGGLLPPPDALGMTLAVASGATWGLYTVLIRHHAPSIPWKDLLLASMLVGFLAFAVTAALTEPFPDVASFTTKTWVWTFIQVLIPTIAALAMFQTALRDAPAGKVSILVGFELAATLVFAMWLLGDRYTLLQWLGLAVVLVAVSLYLWGRARSKDSGGEQHTHEEQHGTDH